MKRFLFVQRAAPHQGVRLQERLDVILTTAAFDQPVSVLFLDDGVFQLKQHQHPETSGLKETLAIFKALALYDVKDLRVEAESLQARGLQVSDLALPVKILERQSLGAWLRQFDIIA